MKWAVLIAALATAAVPATPAGAQLLDHKDLSLAAALTIATTAAATCKAEGNRVSVVVVGREGQVIVLLRGDDASPHTVENARRKAYTARTFRVPSGVFAERVKTNPTIGLVHLSGVIAAQGALPIKIGDDVIGAVGVSGSPGGDKDEACAKAGLDKAAAQLK
ncbi:MAG TPA: heme-binding protein [Stellaceae bacterium]|nr:heme-binding protein [Stellaceae bacterium]